MTIGDWIALSVFAFSLLGVLVSAVYRVARIEGKLDTIIEAIHELVTEDKLLRADVDNLDTRVTVLESRGPVGLNPKQH